MIYNYFNKLFVETKKMSKNVVKEEKKVSEGQWTTGLYDCFSEDISTCNDNLLFYFLQVIRFFLKENISF